MRLLRLPSAIWQSELAWGCVLRPTRAAIARGKRKRRRIQKHKRMHTHTDGRVI